MNNYSKRTFTAFIIITAACTLPAKSQSLFDCSASSGKGYYLESSLLPEEKASWKDDGVSEGGIALVRQGDTIDILIKDIVGVGSVKADGAEVVLVDAYEGFVTVLVNYLGGSKELYTFDSSRKMVFWSQHKFGVMFDKSATYIANCR